MYDTKSKNYFKNVRLDILSALNQFRFEKVLEIGAGGCDTLVYMKQNQLAQEVTAIELFELPNSNQQNPILDKLILGDIAHLDQYDLDKNYFDLIILGDILEHIADPWTTVKHIKKLVSDKGMIICSMPNIREVSTLKKIVLEGDFKYDPESGILDITHLRFFCKKNLINLFKNSGYEIISIKPSFNFNIGQKRRKVINKITLGFFEQFLAFQYFLIAKKSN